MSYRYDIEQEAIALSVSTPAGLAVLARMARPCIDDQMPRGCHATKVALALLDRVEALWAKAV